MMSTFQHDFSFFMFETFLFYAESIKKLFEKTNETESVSLFNCLLINSRVLKEEKKLEECLRFRREFSR